MLLDANLLFYHVGTAFNLTAGEYVSLVGNTSSSTSAVINLGNPRDLGIGDGPEIPKLALFIGGGGITSSCASMLVNVAFQGSTDSVTWTTYVQTGANSTASFAAGPILPIDVPRRPAGIALPLYYRISVGISGGAGTAGISTGTIIGGIVLARGDVDTFGAYPAGFSFPAAG